MKHQKLLSLLLAASLTAGLAGCSGGTNGSAGTPSTNPNPASSKAPAADNQTPTDTSGLKIAVLLSGSPTDGGFCQIGSEAGDAVQEALGLTEAVSKVEVTGAEAIKEEAESMAADGYKIIFGHGGEYASPFAEVAADYPETWFISIGGQGVGQNQFPLCLNTEQGGYLCGVMAGLMTKTNVIGCIYGGDYPAFTKPGFGFEMGAKSVNPNVEVKSAFLSDCNSTEAYETTMVQIKSNADVIFCNADEGNSGSIKAVAENPGVYTFGVFGDYSSLAPDSILVNDITDYKAAYVDAAKACIAGIDTPDTMFLGLADGVISLIWNEQMKDKIPQEVKDAVQDAQDKIISGEIKVPNEYEIAALSN